MNTSDPTESTRRQMVAEINSNAAERQSLAHTHGDVWDTSELQRDFKVLGFMAPFCVVERKSDGQRGSVTFQHSPRFYYDFVAD